MPWHMWYSPRWSHNFCTADEWSHDRKPPQTPFSFLFTFFAAAFNFSVSRICFCFYINFFLVSFICCLSVHSRFCVCLTKQEIKKISNNHTWDGIVFRKNLHDDRIDFNDSILPLRYSCWQIALFRIFPSQHTHKFVDSNKPHHAFIHSLLLLQFLFLRRCIAKITWINKQTATTPIPNAF